MNIRIVVFECVKGPIPPAHRFQAFVMHPAVDPALRAKGEWEFHCVRVSGATKEQAEERCREFWDKELAKAQQNAKGSRGRPQQTHVTPEVLDAVTAN